MTGSTDDGARRPGDTTLFEAGPGLHEGPSPALADDGFETRYELKSLLGEGGMGEVRLCNDVRIGREVAMKLVHPDRQGSERLKASFLQEARIQGRLEHPSVVPVHDLGVAGDGGLYFTMRRVHGTSLDVVLGQQREGEARALGRWTRRRLLTAFSGVCSAVAFAHQRGVVHRDLKPSNIMLGEFGDAYIIDWGCAVIREPDDDKAPRGSTPSDLAGTPGFMAPELLRTSRVEADERADIYALGAILFEILTLDPLHPRGDRDRTLESTRRGADARASVRAPHRDIPPELDAICVRATALDPADRYGTAGELAKAIEAYLDGDRDVELRRRMAEDEAREAVEAARAALDGTDPDGQSRHQAMQAVARALALDPDNALARQTIVRLLMEPPRELPPEAKRQVEQQQAQQALLAARSGMFAYLLWLVFVPLVAWMGIRDVSLVVISVAIMLVASGVGLLILKVRSGRVMRAYVLLGVVTLGLTALSRVAGPYILIPAIAGVNTLATGLVTVRKARVGALVLGCACVVLPAALEWVGVLPPSYVFEDGVMKVIPQMVDFPAVPTHVYLLISNLAVILTGWFVVMRLRNMLEESERRVMLHAWHLNMLVSDRTSAARSPAPEA